MSYTCAVITVSDKGYAGEREDTSGPAVCALAEENGFSVSYTSLVPDDLEMIKNAGMGIAMENGLISVKEEANIITKSNDNSGIAHAINKYIK